MIDKKGEEKRGDYLHRKFSCFFVVIFIFFISSVQAKVKLRGHVTLQNSNGEPVKGVKVRALGFGNPTTSNDSGYFLLVFTQKQPGDIVTLCVSKENFEVINRKSLRVVLTPDPNELLNIVMCKKGSRDKYARIYYGIAEDAIHREYKRKKEFLEITSNDYETKLALLRQERDVAIAQAKELARKFAEVNLDQASALYKSAFVFFKDGKIDQALNALNDEELAHSLENSKKAMQKAEEALRQSIENYLLKARLSILKFKYEDAEAYYRTAVKAAKGRHEIIIEYSKFLYKQRHFKKGLALCQESLIIVKRKAVRGRIFIERGLFHMGNNNFKAAEEDYLKALSILRSLEDQNNGSYTPYIATTLHNLGKLYAKTQRFTKADIVFREALTLRRKLAQIDKQTYQPKVAKTLNGIAIVFFRTQHFTTAEAYYKDAMEIYQELEKKDSDIYRPYVAKTLNNLGVLYNHNKRFSEALDVYTKALNIRRELAVKNPEAFQPDVAKTLNNLANLYFNLDKYEAAENHYQEALKIFKELYLTNPKAYTPFMAGTLNNLANLYLKTRYPDKAESAYNEALKIYREFEKGAPGTFQPDIAETLHNLGVLFTRTQQFEKAKAVYWQALNTRRALAKKNPRVYLPDAALTLNCLGLLYKNAGNFTVAGAAYREALRIYRKLAKGNRDTYRSLVATTLNNLGILYTKIRSFKRAMKAYKEALAISWELADKEIGEYKILLARTLHNTGFCYIRQNKPKKSLHFLHRALDKWEELTKRNKPFYDIRLGNVLLTICFIKAALSDFKETEPKMLNRATMIFKKYPKIPAARHFLNQANELSRHIKEKAKEQQQKDPK